MRARVVIITALSVTTAIASATGCTFGGLASYTIQACDPASTQATDVCDRLNSSDPATCNPYQCDAVTHHCVQHTRDDDRDGDPPITCGGTDCDDHDEARSGKAKEICDHIDNNCDGFVDEDVITPLAERTIAPAGTLTSSADPIVVPTDDARRNGLAAFVGSGGCMPFVSLEPSGGQSVGAGCAVSDALSVPHQPYPLQTSTGNAAAFVATNACPTGRLAYRMQSNTSATPLDLACDVAHPAALPAVAAMPTSANASSGIITWYEATLADRADAVGQCATIKPAPFALLRVPVLASPPPSPAQTDVLIASEMSAATRPAALLPVEPAGGMLVSTPLGNDVGIWLLTPATLVGTTLPTPTHVPLTNARATALAIHPAADTIHVGVVAEIGCHPQASIQFALGTLDAKSGALKFDAPIEVTPPSDVATAPSIAWIDARSEWWVLWVDDAPHVRVRRFQIDGKPVGKAIDVGSRLPLATLSSAESVFALDPTANGGSFVEIPLTCAK